MNVKFLDFFNTTKNGLHIVFGVTGLVRYPKKRAVGG